MHNTTVRLVDGPARRGSGRGRDQFVALDGGVVVDRPAILVEGFSEVEGQPVDIIPIRRGRFCQTAYGPHWQLKRQDARQFE